MACYCVSEDKEDLQRCARDELGAPGDPGGVGYNDSGPNFGIPE